MHEMRSCFNLRGVSFLIRDKSGVRIPRPTWNSICKQAHTARDKHANKINEVTTCSNITETQQITEVSVKVNQRKLIDLEVGVKCKNCDYNKDKQEVYTAVD